MSDEEIKIETKVCEGCDIEKNITDFQFRKDNNKYRSECKKCLSEKRKIYVSENSDKIIERRKENYNKKKENKDIISNKITNIKTKICTQCNFEKRCNIDLNYSDFYFNKNECVYQCKCISCIAENKKNKYDENKEHFRDIQKKSTAKFTEEQKLEVKEYQTEYRKNNKEILQKQNKEWKSNKRKSDTAYKLRANVSRIISLSLNSNGGSKAGNSIMDYLTYTIEELKAHIESQWEDWMNWENHGVYKLGGERKWHIDHIIPQSLLPFDSMEHPNFLKCWALNNIRPLDAVENMLKSDNISEELKNETFYKIVVELKKVA